MHIDLSWPIISIVAILADWIIRFGALFIVPRNRKPSSATAWLMLILLLPFVGVFIYLLIGSPKLPKKRQEQQRKIDELINEKIRLAKNNSELSEYIELNPNDRIKPFAQLNNNLSGLPIFKNNDIEVIDEYYEAIEHLTADINKAKKYVHIEYYIIAMDDKTEGFFVALEKAVKRGVVVRLLYDAIGSKKYPNFKQMQARLTNSGIDWQPMLPLKLPGKGFTRPDLRNHRKIAIIDGEIAYTGSLNLIDRTYHRKDELCYDELVARAKGPIVSQFGAIFVTDWFSETGELLNNVGLSRLGKTPHSGGKVLAQVLPSGPGYKEFNNLKLFTGLIHSAKERIVITNPYFVPDDSLMLALTSAAQRGVEVIMINSKIIDQNFVGNAQRSFYEEMLKSGVKIYLYKWPVLLHSKHMTIDDDMAVIGSSNLDLRSFQLDLEVSLVTYNNSVVDDLKKVQTKNLADSELLTLEKWQKRGELTKFKENIARLTSALQ